MFSSYSDNFIQHHLIVSGSTELASINAAIEEYQSLTCVTFVFSATAAYRLNIFKGQGCYSYIGRVHSGLQPQELSLADGCASVSTVFFTAFPNIIQH